VVERWSTSWRRVLDVVLEVVVLVLAVAVVVLAVVSSWCGRVGAPCSTW